MCKSVQRACQIVTTWCHTPSVKNPIEQKTMIVAGVAFIAISALFSPFYAVALACSAVLIKMYRNKQKNTIPNPVPAIEIPRPSLALPPVQPSSIPSSSSQPDLQKTSTSMTATAEIENKDKDAAVIPPAAAAAAAATMAPTRQSGDEQEAKRTGAQTPDQSPSEQSSSPLSTSLTASPRKLSPALQRKVEDHELAVQRLLAAGTLSNDHNITILVKTSSGNCFTLDSNLTAMVIAECFLNIQKRCWERQLYNEAEWQALPSYIRTGIEREEHIQKDFQYNYPPSHFRLLSGTRLFYPQESCRDATEDRCQLRQLELRLPSRKEMLEKIGMESTKAEALSKQLVDLDRIAEQLIQGLTCRETVTTVSETIENAQKGIESLQLDLEGTCEKVIYIFNFSVTIIQQYLKLLEGVEIEHRQIAAGIRISNRDFPDGVVGTIVRFLSYLPFDTHPSTAP